MSTTTTANTEPQNVHAQVIPIAEQVFELVRQKKELEKQIDALRGELKKIDLKDKNHTRFATQSGAVTIQRQVAFKDQILKNRFHTIEPELREGLIAQKILKYKRLVNESRYEALADVERARLLNEGVLEEELVCKKRGGRHFFVGEQNQTMVDRLLEQGAVQPSVNYLRVALSTNI